MSFTYGHYTFLPLGCVKLCSFSSLFGCSIKEGERESCTEMPMGSLTQTTWKWSPRDAPRISYTFSLKQALIYCLEMGNNSSRYEATLNSSRYETTLKTKRKLQIISKFLIVVSKKEVGIKVYKLNEFRPSTRTKINLRS